MRFTGSKEESMKIYDSIKRRLNPIRFWKSKGLVIGDFCEVYASANFGSEPYLVRIGDHVRVNAGVNFVTHDGGVWVLRYLKDDFKDIDLFGRIRIGTNVHIGTNAIIMPGVTIGNNCIIGCGAIVTHDIPDNSIAAGVPARVIENVEEYCQKHEDAFLHTKAMNAKDKRKYLESFYSSR